MSRLLRWLRELFSSFAPPITPVGQKLLDLLDQEDRWEVGFDDNLVYLDPVTDGLRLKLWRAWDLESYACVTVDSARILNDTENDAVYEKANTLRRKKIAEQNERFYARQRAAALQKLASVS
jgi:hypothetical protein